MLTSKQREVAVLNLLFLSNTVQLAFVHGHLEAEETALHHVSIADDIIAVCDGDLPVEDVLQSELLTG